MWRALLGRRLALLSLAVALALGVSYYRAGPQPDVGYGRAAGEAELSDVVVATNIAAHLARSHRLEVAPGDIRVLPARDAPLGQGRPAVAWFTAGPPGAADLQAMRLRVSPRGVPVAIADPHNITRTPDGHELLLDADPGRVLYAIKVGDRIPSVVLLDFAGQMPAEMSVAARAVAAVAARQSFGTWSGPDRIDLLLSAPAEDVAGFLTPEGFTVATDVAELTVDLGAERVEPPAAGQLLVGAPPEHEALGLAADALRRSMAVGAQRVIAVEDVLFRVTDWLRQQQHRLFPTAADRLPIAPIVEAAESTSAWPPPPVAQGDVTGMPGEGEWTPAANVADAVDPEVLQTFVRVDPERPFQRTHLIAFDMRRLGLHFVSGTRHPRSTTGARGSGRVPDAHRPNLVAAFNGGFKAEHGRFGVIESGRLLVTPVRGLATVVTDADGRAGFGLWDAEGLGGRWRGLRQNLAPLIEAGVVNPRRVKHWGKLVADLDEARTPRSALGVTASGALVYGWSSATSAERLGEAMLRAGVDFAMHLDMNPGHTGLELYRALEERIEPSRAAPQMDYRLGRWLATDARDFFYVVRADRRPNDLAERDWAPDEGRWRMRQRLDGIGVLSETWISAERSGGARLARLYLLESDRVQPSLVPGLAEARPVTGVPPAELTLPGLPLAWFDIGLSLPQSPHGLIVGGQVWRAPRSGIMTLGVHPEGHFDLGRFGSELSRDGRWQDLIQGPTLVEGGELGEAARGRNGTPLTAAGLRADGRLVLGTMDDGDRRALARAMVAAGVSNALILGLRGTMSAGQMRLFYAQGEQVWMTVGPTGALYPARFTPGASTGLVFTGRRPPPAVEVLSTFVRPPGALPSE